MLALFGRRKINSSAENPKSYKLAILASKLMIHSRSSEFLGSIKQIRETFKRMPPDVVLIFKATESDSGVSLDDVTRKRYYEEFCKATSGFGGAGLLDMQKAEILFV